MMFWEQKYKNYIFNKFNSKSYLKEADNILHNDAKAQEGDLSLTSKF